MVSLFSSWRRAFCNEVVLSLGKWSFFKAGREFGRSKGWGEVVRMSGSVHAPLTLGCQAEAHEGKQRATCGNLRHRPLWPPFSSSVKWVPHPLVPSDGTSSGGRSEDLMTEFMQNGRQGACTKGLLLTSFTKHLQHHTPHLVFPLPNFVATLST